MRYIIFLILLVSLFSVYAVELPEPVFSQNQPKVERPPQIIIERDNLFRQMETRMTLDENSSDFEILNDTRSRVMKFLKSDKSFFVIHTKQTDHLEQKYIEDLALFSENLSVDTDANIEVAEEYNEKLDFLEAYFEDELNLIKEDLEYVRERPMLARIVKDVSDDQFGQIADNFGFAREAIDIERKQNFVEEAAKLKKSLRAKVPAIQIIDVKNETVDISKNDIRAWMREKNISDFDVPDDLLTFTKEKSILRLINRDALDASEGTFVHFTIVPVDGRLRSVELFEHIPEDYETDMDNVVFLQQPDFPFNEPIASWDLGVVEENLTLGYVVNGQKESDTFSILAGISDTPFTPLNVSKEPVDEDESDLWTVVLFLAVGFLAGVIVSYYMTKKKR